MATIKEETKRTLFLSHNETDIIKILSHRQSLTSGVLVFTMNDEPDVKSFVRVGELNGGYLGSFRISKMKVETPFVLDE